MAKKNIRSEQSDPHAARPPIERRRTVRATTRKAAPGTNVPVTEPDSSAAAGRDTAHDAPAGGNGSSTSAPSYEEIAEAAYHRYVQRGGQHGYDFDDWIDAERALRARS